MQPENPAMERILLDPHHRSGEAHASLHTSVAWDFMVLFSRCILQANLFVACFIPQKLYIIHPITPEFSLANPYESS